MVSNTISTLGDVFLIYRVKMDATSGAGTVYHLKAGEFTPVFREVRDAHYPVFYVMFCRIFISFRSLHCLSFFVLLLLIITSVSANPSGTPGYRNGNESFFGLKGHPSVVRDV
jgi:hypothetical protein